MKKNRQELIDDFLATPIAVGDLVYVMGLGNQNKEQWGGPTAVKKIKGTTLFYKHYELLDEVDASAVKRYTGHIGVNPFDSKRYDIRHVAFTLESVLSMLKLTERSTRDYKPWFEDDIEIQSCNFNPFVYDESGHKVYYQRPLCWTERDKQLLIESIYLGIECGKILVRRRGIEEIQALRKKGETELSLHDIVDGKQRLNAVASFINGEFPDMHGNYYDDLTEAAQYRLVNHQLFSYCEMQENTKDKDVIAQFLKMNFCGVPQSEEHLQYVKNINL